MSGSKRITAWSWMLTLLLGASAYAEITVNGNVTVDGPQGSQPLAGSAGDQTTGPGEVVNFFDATVTVTDTTTFTSETLVLGRQADATSSLLINTGGQLVVTDTLFIGDVSDGDLEVDAGTLVANNITMDGATERVNIMLVQNGGQLDSAGLISINDGLADITTGSTVNANIISVAATSDAGAFFTFTDAGTTLNATDLIVGGVDTSVAVGQNGAALNLTGNLLVGSTLDADGSFRLEGAGTTANIDGFLVVGFADVGAADSIVGATINVTDGAELTVGQDFSLAGQPSSFTFGTVDGAASLMTTQGNSLIGVGGNGGFQVNNGGTYTGGGDLLIGLNPNADGRFSSLGGGNAVIEGGTLVGGAGGTGSIFWNGGTFSTASLAIGVNDGGNPQAGTNGAVTFLEGAQVTVGQDTLVGSGEGSFASLRLTGAGTTFTTPELFVGANFEGAGSNGSVSVADGASVVVNGAAEFGFGAGTGSLDIANGGTFQAPLVRFGFDNPDQPNGGELLAGDLFLDGGTLIGNVDLEANASINGRGTITGDVTNNGARIATAVGAEFGTLLIDGNYTQTAGILDFNVGGAEEGMFDRLFVTGDLNLQAGEVNLDFVNGFTPAGGEQFSVLAAQGESFIDETVAFNVGTGETAFEFNLAPGQVIDPRTGQLVNAQIGSVNLLNANLADIAELGGNDNSLAMNIDQTCTVNQGAGAQTPDQQDLANVCMQLRNAGNTPEQVAQVLEAVGTEETTQTTNSLLLFTVPSHGNLSQRINGIRAGSNPFDFAGLQIGVGDQMIAGEDIERFIKGIIGGAASADDDFARFGMFGNGNINFGDKDATRNGSGFDYTTINLTIGADYRLRDDLILGGSFSYSDVNADFDEGGGMDVESWSISGFGSYFIGEQFYLDVLATYGENDLDISRHITFDAAMGGLDRRANSDTDGSQYSISVGTGWDFTPGKWTIGPHGGLNYTELQTDPYTETGAGGLNLSVERQNATSATMNLGFHASYTFTPNWGVITPYVQADVVREFETSAEVIDIRFAADRFASDPNNPTPPIRVETDERDPYYTVVSAGFSAQLVNGVSGFLAYRGTFGLQDIALSDVTWGVRFERKF